MTCSSCETSVEKSIKILSGIKLAVVDVLNNTAQVIFCPSVVNEEMIRESIQDIGFQAKLIEEEMNQKSSLACRIQVNGMTCTSCSTTLESALLLLEAIGNPGFEGILISTGGDNSRILLKVDGINTENCVRLIKNSLLALQGVQEIDFDLQLRKLSVSYTADVTGPREFIRAIESTGPGCFKESIFPEERDREEHRHHEIRKYHRAFYGV
ncbi:hypothetical protein K7X08_029386 [Anisodus acutangulus]|uniref:HMA domain-containing protein n=1 Tax=Anisodus acutangulus TaxID=402998 RepID=A0A9Q1QU39_9SOLA|nr:hypothetical protein K7X08_029386 [Anisodus acutangulus]